MDIRIYEKAELTELDVFDTTDENVYIYLAIDKTDSKYAYRDTGEPVERVKVGFTHDLADRMNRIGGQTSTDGCACIKYYVVDKTKFLSDVENYRLADTKLHEMYDIIWDDKDTTKEKEWFKPTNGNTLENICQRFDNIIKLANEGKSVEDIKNQLHEKKLLQLYNHQEDGVEKAIDLYNACINAGKPNYVLMFEKTRAGKSVEAFKFLSEIFKNNLSDKPIRPALFITHFPATLKDYKNLIDTYTDFDNIELIFNTKNDSEGNLLKEKIDTAINSKAKDKKLPVLCLSAQVVKQLVEGKVKEKFKFLQEIQLSCVLMDECHYGFHKWFNPNSSELTLGSMKFNTDFFYLMSATPYNMLSSNSIDKEQIRKFSYQMEQGYKKIAWGNSPLAKKYVKYKYKPTLNIHNIHINKMLKEISQMENNTEFSISAFMKNGIVDCKYDDAQTKRLIKFFGFLCGSSNYNPDMWKDYTTFSEVLSSMPFSEENRDKHKFGFIRLSGVKEAKALYNFLKEYAKKYNVLYNGFGEYYNFNLIAGDDGGEGEKAMETLQDDIKKAKEEGKGLITILCDKLTVGVTVPDWSFCLLMNSGNSTSDYVQTVGRLLTENVKYENFEAFDLKKDGSDVYDFEPNRSLHMIQNWAVYENSTEAMNSVEDMEKFLNHLNLYAVNGFEYKTMSAEDVFDIISEKYESYNSSSSLNFYNNNVACIKEFLEDEKIKEAIFGLEKWKTSSKTIGINNDNVLGKHKKEKSSKTDNVSGSSFMNAWKEHIISIAKGVSKLQIRASEPFTSVKSMYENVSAEDFKTVYGFEQAVFEKMVNLGMFTMAFNTYIFTLGKLFADYKNS